MSTYCFSVLSEATPTSLPRLLDVFALHGFVPDRCHSTCVGADASELAVDLHLRDVTPEQARLLAKRLARVVTVSNVLYSEKRLCAA